MGCDPLSSSSVHGISQARILEWIAVSRGSPWPRNQTCSSCSFCIGRYILYHWVTWEPRLLSLLHQYLTCFGVFHLNINKQATSWFHTLLQTFPQYKLLFTAEHVERCCLHTFCISSFPVDSQLLHPDFHLHPLSKQLFSGHQWPPRAKSDVSSHPRFLPHIPASLKTGAHSPWKTFFTGSLLSLIPWAVPLLCSSLSLFPMLGTQVFAINTACSELSFLRTHTLSFMVISIMMLNVT